MVDPGADASLGGMAACGASGTMAVKYGTMRDNVLAVEAVLPDGSIVQTGSRAIKSSAGYDLTRLMVGSEGTLGIITSVTVKVHPIPTSVQAAVCAFDSLHDAAEAVTLLKQCDVQVQRLELLDASSIRAFNKYNANKHEGSSPMPLQPHLFLEFAGASDVTVQEQVQLASEVMEDFDVAITVESDPDKRRDLWAARHDLYYASIRLRDGAEHAIVTDACVPLSEFANILQATADDIDTLDVVATCFGHAGDGNFHCILPTLPSDSEDYRARQSEMNNRLIQRTLDVGGTCTGEHGVGYGKVPYLEQQYSPPTIGMMRSIKLALDPRNLMNPGKVIKM
jgi:D-lactate dehydrogenase (cytochrome)